MHRRRVLVPSATVQRHIRLLAKDKDIADTMTAKATSPEPLATPLQGETPLFPDVPVLAEAETAPDTGLLPEAIVAVFPDHIGAENAIKRLSEGGFDISQLSVVGKGYHLDEQVIGFYNQGDRIRFWGTRGAFWGGLWSLFFGGVFLAVPVVGPVMVLGYLAATAVAVLEGAVLVGGISAFAAALYGLGIPKNSVIQYEAAIATDSFLVMAHDTPDRIAHARALLADSGASSIDVHSSTELAARPQPLDGHN